jgi:hypothetical protein
VEPVANIGTDAIGWQPGQPSFLRENSGNETLKRTTNNEVCLGLMTAAEYHGACPKKKKA